MKKLILLLLLTSNLALAKDLTNEYSGDMPEYMKDCRVVLLEGELFSKELFVVYCPMASTETTWMRGKVNEHSSVVNE